MTLTAAGEALQSVYDLKGYQSTFGVSAAILCASAVLAYLGWRAGSKATG